MAPRSPIEREDSIISTLVALRDFCAANDLPALEGYISECVAKCETLYVERRRAAFRDKDAGTH